MGSQGPPGPPAKRTPERSKGLIASDQAFLALRKIRDAAWQLDRVRGQAPEFEQIAGELMTIAQVVKIVAWARRDLELGL